MNQNTLMLAVFFFLFINVFFLVYIQCLNQTLQFWKITFKRKNNLFLAIDRG